MSLLTDFLQPRKRLLQQESELQELRAELLQLRAQNESMREGMRRCVTCEYRIESKALQDEKLR